MAVVGWADVPVEIRCLILSLLPPKVSIALFFFLPFFASRARSGKFLNLLCDLKEIALTASLVSKTFHQAASHDDVWRLLCQRHFPHHDTDISTEFISSLFGPPPNHFAFLITVFFFLHLAEDTPGTRMQCISKAVKDEEYPSWLHRYRAYYHRLFVIHHKYNAINEGALADAVAKWTQAGAIITGLGLSHLFLKTHSFSNRSLFSSLCVDMRASTDDFLEPKVTEWITEIRKVMRRHRVVYIFSDGGMKDWYRGPIGDALADFVEEGNTVIVGTFSNVAKRMPPNPPSLFSLAV